MGWSHWGAAGHGCNKGQKELVPAWQGRQEQGCGECPCVSPSCTAKVRGSTGEGEVAAAPPEPTLARADSNPRVKGRKGAGAGSRAGRSLLG